MDERQAVAALIDCGRQLYRRGCLPATSGNLSLRLADDRLAMTVSGCCKGHLDSDVIMFLDPEGKPLDHRRPSAETGLHVQVYHAFPAVGVVLHTHSLVMTLLSELMTDGWVLSGLELLKAFPGIDSHLARVQVAIFDNDQDIERLARQIAPALASLALPGYLLRGHGLYVWGSDMVAAKRHLEAFEYLGRYELARRGMGLI